MTSTSISPTAGVSNYYPLPFASGPFAGWGLPSAVLSADFDGSPTSLITLSISTLPYEANAGELPFFNGGGGPKTIDVVGQGAPNSVITGGGNNRVAEVFGSSALNVAFRSLGIQGGYAATSGSVGVGAAGADPGFGGGLLIDGGVVTLSGVSMYNNVAAGSAGFNGSNGHSATTDNPTGGNGGNGGNGGSAAGGGIYLTGGGSLTLVNDTLASNIAQGGAGGAGGHGGNGYSTFFIFHSGNAGNGGDGGLGGSAQGGGIYVALGNLSIYNTAMLYNEAVGGAGGAGGGGGRGGWWTYAAGNGGSGGSGGNGSGGGFYLACCSFNFSGGVFADNLALGGAGGHGGYGGTGGTGFGYSLLNGSSGSGTTGLFGHGNAGGNGGNAFTGGTRR